MRLGNTEAADDDSRQGVVYTCDVLGQGGRSRKRRGIGISEDLARGRRKKCPQRGLRRATCIHCIYLIDHHTALHATASVVTGRVCWLV